MDEDRLADDEPNVMEGADDAALGTGAPPSSAPPGAEVDATRRLVPGAGGADASEAGGAKPWASSLAARGPHAGVANEEPEDAPPDPAFDDANGG